MAPLSLLPRRRRIYRTPRRQDSGIGIGRDPAFELIDEEGKIVQMPAFHSRVIEFKTCLQALDLALGAKVAAAIVSLPAKR